MGGERSKWAGSGVGEGPGASKARGAWGEVGEGGGGRRAANVVAAHKK